jgi:hypothetical protein
MRKEIYSWKWGNNETRDEDTSTRGYILGGYNSSFERICAMAAEAKKDFPNLQDKDIEVGFVTSSRCVKNFWGIHFPLPNETRHKDYSFREGTPEFFM